MEFKYALLYKVDNDRFSFDTYILNKALISLGVTPS